MDLIVLFSPSAFSHNLKEEESTHYKYGYSLITVDNISDWDALLDKIQRDTENLTTQLLISKLKAKQLESIKSIDDVKQLNKAMKEDIVTAFNAIKNNLTFYKDEIVDKGIKLSSDVQKELNNLKEVLEESGELKKEEYKLSDLQIENIKWFNMAILKQLFPQVLSKSHHYYIESDPEEKSSQRFIQMKYPDTGGIDIVTDAPWMVLRGREIPLLLFVPDANIEDDGSNKFLGISFTRITVFQDSRIIYEDKCYEDNIDRQPSLGGSLQVIDEYGEVSSPNLVGSSKRSIVVSRPGGWHRIIRIPSVNMNKEEVFFKTEIVAKLEYEKPVDNKSLIYFSRSLRVNIANYKTLPSLGYEWHYYDAHFHTIAEWSLGEKLLSPRKAFGGPIQMIKESAYAMGLIDSIYSLTDRVIATDHNSFFSDDFVLPVGPSADKWEYWPISSSKIKDYSLSSMKDYDYFLTDYYVTPVGSGTDKIKAYKRDCYRFPEDDGQREYENLHKVFGKTFGEEVTLKTDFNAEKFNGGSHLILFRGKHVKGPWHGGLLYYRFLGMDFGKWLGGERNDNTLESVLKDAAYQKNVPFAFAAHPFAKGNHWNMKKGTERYLDLLLDNSEDYITKNGIKKFVFKGAQYWNGKPDNIYCAETRRKENKRGKIVIKRKWLVDFFDLHPFKDAPGTRAPPEGRKFKVKRNYTKFKPDQKWDKELEVGLCDWHRRIRWLLRFSLDGKPDEVFPRKIYMVGGSDAHGDFNYETSLLATILDNVLFRAFGASNRKLTSNAFAKVRTYVNFNGKSGVNSREKALNAFADGNSVVTDGPVITFSFDSDLRFNSEFLRWKGRLIENPDHIKAEKDKENYNSDGRIGGNGDYDGGFTALVVKGAKYAGIAYQWNNYPEFGGETPYVVKLYLDTPEKRNESSIVSINSKNIEKVESIWKRKVYDQDAVILQKEISKLHYETPLALSMGIFAKKEGLDQDYRCYTNPIWIIPVEVFLSKAKVDNGRIQPGKLKIEFKFEMSMIEKPYEVMLSLLDEDENVTGAPYSLIADKGYGKNGWDTYANLEGLKIGHGEFHVKNEKAIELSENKNLQKFLICLKEPQDLHGNMLNSIAALVDLATLNIVDKAMGDSVVAGTDDIIKPQGTTVTTDSETEDSTTTHANSQGVSGPDGNVGKKKPFVDAKKDNFMNYEYNFVLPVGEKIKAKKYRMVFAETKER